MSRVTDRLTVAGFRAGWAGVRMLPERAAYRLFDVIADVAVRRRTRGVRRLRANYARVRPELNDSDLDALVRAGMRAYLRYYCEAFRLPALTAAQVDERVVAVGDGPVREQLALGRPVVCFLGHMGNWDLAGAWCCRALGRVVTVAERLEPAEVFAEFLDFRTGLGMTIIPLTGAGDVFAELQREMAASVVVPLLADRDLTGGGLEVDFCGHPARMAVGPAALAVTGDAVLFPVSIRHLPRRRGWGIEITFHDQVRDPGVGTARERTAAMTQACAAALGAAVQRHTADWHMLQRVFSADVTAPRGP
ncbi:MAG: phosphatidylinositol mannoside acyltransferase [Tetrasphaera sp.]